MADFEQVENCISFAENEGYTEWAKGAEDELTLYRVRLSAAEQERDKALTTAQVFLAVLPIAFAEVLHDAHAGWLDGREPDFSEETTKAKLREVCRRAGIAEGIPDVPALNARIAAADARAEATEEALRKIAYPARSDWLPGEWPEVIRRMQAIARAALAGREESHDCRCDGNPSGGSCVYPDCKRPPPTTEELLGLAGREETGGG